MMNTPLPLFINGEWMTTDETQPVVNPFTQEVVGHVCLGRESQMDAAITAAFAARRPLADLTNAARGDALDSIRAGLASHQEDLARTLCLESGKPIKDARVEVQRAVHVFQIAAEEARRFGSGEVIPLDRLPSSAHRMGLTRRFPAGVVGAITPFNFPLNLVAHKVAPALAAGCPLVLKPAHQTPMTALALARIFAGAKLPAGAFNVVHTPPNIGESLATDPRVAVLSFTGSANVGWRLKSLANAKRVTLELGGNAAVIVHDDADVSFAAARCVVGAFSYSGQVCISVQRIYVHTAIYEAFLEEFIAGAKNLQAGDPLNEKTDIGPLISEDAAKRIEAWVQEAITDGARLLLGTGRAEGQFVGPTVLSDTTPNMAVNREEVFGPVVTVTPYRDFDEALGRVNDTAYGLQAGVFTQDVGRLFLAFETLEVGGVIGNDVPTYRIDHMPYGGIKGSGFGREGVRYAMEEMSELRLLALNLA